MCEKEERTPTRNKSSAALSKREFGHLQIRNFKFSSSMRLTWATFFDSNMIFTVTFHKVNFHVKPVSLDHQP